MPSTAPTKRSINAKEHGRNRVDCYEMLVAQGELKLRAPASGEVELF